MPGVMQKPEHKKPLDRYEIDRSNLGNNNVPTENIDSIYRALYVHSVGFYKQLKESTCNANGKEYIQSNIWRVFQILLEHACKTEYRIITRTLEEHHRGQVDELEKKILELNTYYAGKVRELKLRMAELDKEYVELDLQKTMI